MIERYSREEMSSKWTMQAKYQAWLDVEIAVVKAWNRLGLIPDDDAKKIVDNAGFSVERIDEIEAITRHDLIAFTTSVSETLGEESRWFHYGMTSSDTVDTAVALQMTASLEIIMADVKMMMESIEIRAKEHKMTLMVGRSHGIHGEPITFGLVLAVWYDEMARHLKNLEQTMEVISVGQISGAMGNFAHAPLELEEYAMEELGLKPEPCSNQVVHRD
ncbi:MAG TPA: adenylosuccinate lyase, partial [Sulfurovum sp.]|nr:adenylosuccinate lyase [Sulfurovum sp.]